MMGDPFSSTRLGGPVAAMFALYRAQLRQFCVTPLQKHGIHSSGVRAAALKNGAWQMSLTVPSSVIILSGVAMMAFWLLIASQLYAPWSLSWKFRMVRLPTPFSLVAVTRGGSGTLAQLRRHEISGTGKPTASQVTVTVSPTLTTWLASGGLEMVGPAHPISSEPS